MHLWLDIFEFVQFGADDNVMICTIPTPISSIEINNRLNLIIHDYSSLTGK